MNRFFTNVTVACLVFLWTGFPGFSQLPGNPFTPLDETWQVVGQPGFSDYQACYNCIAISPESGEPYVAYADSPESPSTLSGYCVVKRFDGAQWIPVDMTGFINSTVGHLNMAFSPLDSLPYIAFSSSCSSQLQATLMRFNGTAWEYVGGGGASEGQASYLSLAFNPVDGQPWLAFMDDPVSKKMSVRRYDGSAWVYVGSRGFTAGEPWYIQLVFSPAGVPYVAFKDWAYGQALSVMSFNGTNWSYVGAPGFTEMIGLQVGLAVSPVDGSPYVAYSTASSGRATVQRFDGSTWTDVGDPSITLGFATALTFVITPSGKPYFSFWDSSFPGMCLLKYEETGWEYVGGTGFTAAYVDYPALALASGDTPFLAYMDEGNSNKITVQKYDFPTGIAEHPPVSLALYPNPVSDALHLALNGGAGKTIRLEVYDIQGKLLVSNSGLPETLALDTRPLAKGIYTVKVIQGTSVSIAKFSKQ